jgi:pilus assembly protein Flp/PilA
MLKYYIKASDLLARLRTDKDGVVSFEYVIVAACVVGAVAAAFGTGATGGIGAALTAGITKVTTAFTTAIGG